MKFSKIFVLAITLMLASTAVSYAQSNTEELKVTVIKLKVKGITCATDLKTISANIKKLKGITVCKAGKAGPTSTFEISYDPTLVTKEEIHKAIEGTAGCHNPDERPYKVKQ